MVGTDGEKDVWIEKVYWDQGYYTWRRGHGGGKEIGFVMNGLEERDGGPSEKSVSGERGVK